MGSGVGRSIWPGFLLLLNVVSIGVGLKRLFPAKSLFSVWSWLRSGPLSLCTFLLLRAVVSTGSGANRRAFLGVSSTGSPTGGLGWSDMVEIGGVDGRKQELCDLQSEIDVIR